MKPQCSTGWKIPSFLLVGLGRVWNKQLVVTSFLLVGQACPCLPFQYLFSPHIIVLHLHIIFFFFSVVLSVCCETLTEHMTDSGTFKTGVKHFTPWLTTCHCSLYLQELPRAKSHNSAQTSVHATGTVCSIPPCNTDPYRFCMWLCYELGKTLIFGRDLVHSVSQPQVVWWLLLHCSYTPKNTSKHLEPLFFPQSTNRCVWLSCYVSGDCQVMYAWHRWCILFCSSISYEKGLLFYTHTYIYVSTIIRHTDIVINVVVKVTSVQNPAQYCFLGCYLSGIFETHNWKFFGFFTFCWIWTIFKNTWEFEGRKKREKQLTFCMLHFNICCPCQWENLTIACLPVTLCLSVL